MERPERPPAPTFDDAEIPETHHADLDPNRFSMVSINSLQPPRRHRPRSSNHAHHAYREFAHMISISEREAKEMRRGLTAALDKLEQSRTRAQHAERMALEMAQRVREASEERLAATRQSQATREELGMYKVQLTNAQSEIQRAQEMLREQERLRFEAEASAARARDTARKLNQDRLIDLAREEGRRSGYREGVRAGTRIGFYDARPPPGLRDRNATPRYVPEPLDDMMPEDDFLDDPYYDTELDPPPISRSVDIEAELRPIPPTLHRDLLRSYQRSDQPPVPPPVQPQPPPEFVYDPGPPEPEPNLRTHPRQRPPSESSVASSSTLPLAPTQGAPRIFSSRPAMPTIPEVVNTEPTSSRRSSRRRSNAPQVSQDAFEPRTPSPMRRSPGSDIPPPRAGQGDRSPGPMYVPTSPIRREFSPPPPGTIDNYPGGYVSAPPPPGSIDNFPSPRHAGRSIRREFSPPPPGTINDFPSPRANGRSIRRDFAPPPPGTINEFPSPRMEPGRSIQREFSPPPPGSVANAQRYTSDRPVPPYVYEPPPPRDADTRANAASYPQQYSQVPNGGGYPQQYGQGPSNGGGYPQQYSQPPPTARSRAQNQAIANTLRHPPDSPATSSSGPVRRSSFTSVGRELRR